MNETKIVADLHIHTNASDGLYTPAHVTDRAIKHGLEAIAITDHDTVDGIGEAIRSSHHSHLEVIPGIELSTEYRDLEIHILGFYIDIGHDRLRRLLRELRQSREDRSAKMVKKLTTLGYDIDLARVRQIAGLAVPGRPHIARALAEKGLVGSVRGAFDSLIAYGGPAYVERYKLTPVEAITMVREAGGVSVMAHPGLSRAGGLIDELVCHGLQGLEICHPEHNTLQTECLRVMAKERGLLVTGGSDFHGGVRESGSEIAARGVNRGEFSKLKALWSGIISKRGFH